MRVAKQFEASKALPFGSVAMIQLGHVKLSLDGATMCGSLHPEGLAHPREGAWERGELEPPQRCRPEGR